MPHYYFEEKTSNWKIRDGKPESAFIKKLGIIEIKDGKLEIAPDQDPYNITEEVEAYDEMMETAQNILVKLVKGYKSKFEKKGDIWRPIQHVEGEDFSIKSKQYMLNGDAAGDMINISLEHEELCFEDLEQYVEYSTEFDQDMPYIPIDYFKEMP